jgi:hypothetical protein
MLFDLNLSMLPHLKDYNGLLFEVLLALDRGNLRNNYIFKELINSLKLFSKLSFFQIFFDLGFFILKTYLKRCHFGLCDFFLVG